MRHPTMFLTRSTPLSSLLLFASLFSSTLSSPLPSSHDDIQSPPLHQLHRRYYDVDQSTVIPVATIVGVIILATFYCSCAGCCKAKNHDPSLTPAQNAELAFEIHTIGCPKNPNTTGKDNTRGRGRCTCASNGLDQVQPGIIHAFGCPKRPGLGQLGHHPDAQCTCSALGEAYGPRNVAVPPMPPNEIPLGLYSHDGQVIHPNVDAPPPYSPPVNTTLRGPEPVYSPQREGRANATVWTDRDVNRQAPEVQRGRGWSRWAA